jgi:ABC-type sugar transport system ATPase subunit
VNVLEVRGLHKRFGSQRAVDDVSFTLLPGEVHGLVGENGAGKSTVIKILSGVYRPDAGEVLVDGRPVQLDSPRDSAAAGIGVIHQQPALVPSLDVGENVTLGTPYATRAGIVDWKAQHQRARGVLERVGLRVDVRTPLHALSVAEQQLVAIARVLLERHRAIVLDEVTASLTASEVQRLFGLIEQLRADGVAFVYVSHRLEEVLALAQRVTVLRNGRLVATRERAGLDAAKLTELIIGSGRELLDRRGGGAARAAGTHREPLLVARGLVAPGVHDVSLTVGRGEVLGLAGLAGAGRTELLQCLFGVRRLRAGEMWLGGRPYRPRDPADAVAAGLALVTEDRKQDGFAAEDPVWQTISLPSLKRFRGRTGVLSLRAERRFADDVARRFDVRSASTASLMRELSGGNQQKAILGRWLSREPALLLLDEPTHGVDVGAKDAIAATIRDVAERGTAVIVVSSELDELEALCDRVLMLVEGRSVGELAGPELTTSAMLETLFRTRAAA